jgi:hypothetical protein
MCDVGGSPDGDPPRSPLQDSATDMFLRLFWGFSSAR